MSNAEESDDSDAEGGLGNVTRVVLRPPGHSGKAKRGHLCFDASFEGGNLGRVDFISEYEYDLFIRPDTCNPRYRLWFNFVVDNVRVDQRVIFNLVNLCKTNTLFKDGMTPLVKTSSRPKWQRLGDKYVYYHKSPEHRNHYILSFAFAFDKEEDVYQFALSFPYSYSRAQAHIELLMAKDYPYLTRDTIGYSLQNRKLDVLTITSVGCMTTTTGMGGGGGGKRTKVVVVMGRTHPGESSTSFVAQGLLDFLLSSHPIATFLRDHLVIKIIPMINPDGVFMGNYRSSLMGYDLNRQWNQVSPWTHPTLHALRNYLVELDANKTVDLDMVVDLHVHTSLMGTFIYGNSYDDVYRFERHILFPKLLAHNAEDYNSSHTMYNRDPNKIGTARRHLCEILRNTVNVYTLQVSILGYTQPSTGATILYNEEGYFRLGRNIARTFFEYYKVTGVLPPSALATTTQSQSTSTEGEKKTGRSGRRSRSRSRPPIAAKSGQKSKGTSATSTELTTKTIVQLSKLTRAKNSDDEDEDDVDADADEADDADVDASAEESDADASSGNVTSTTPEHDETQSISTRRNRLPRKIRDNLLQNQQRISMSRARSPSPSPTLKIVTKIQRTAYKTFDFSILKDVEYLGGGGGGSRRKKFTSNPRHGPGVGAQPHVGRKIGGGGIVGKSSSKCGPNKKVKGQGGRNSSPSPNTSSTIPSLTIIDFNLLIRAGLENRLQLGRERREALRGARPGPGPEGASRFRRKNHYVRRRLAMVLRGNVTDCSPWEDSGSCSDSARNHSAPPPLTRTNSNASSKTQVN